MYLLYNITKAAVLHGAKLEAGEAYLTSRNISVAANCPGWCRVRSCSHTVQPHLLRASPPVMGETRPIEPNPSPPALGKLTPVKLKVQMRMSRIKHRLRNSSHALSDGTFTESSFTFQLRPVQTDMGGDTATRSAEDGAKAIAWAYLSPKVCALDWSDVS